MGVSVLQTDGRYIPAKANLSDSIRICKYVAELCSISSISIPCCSSNASIMPSAIKAVKP